MGGGASKNRNQNNVVPVAPRRPSYVTDEAIHSQPLVRTSSPLPKIPSAREKSPSLRSQASAKRRSSNIINALDRRSSVRPTSNKTISENDNVSLPPLAGQSRKTTARKSARETPVRPPPPLDVSRSGSGSSSESFPHKHRKSSSGIHGHTGRCSKCPHCRRLDINISSHLSTPAPPWLLAEPGADQVRIDMDNYDIEAVKEKIVARNHHPLGSYDYQPYLTIETKKGEYDPMKENYYTQPFVAKTKPRITPLRTPFPDYDLLERRELRLNKPYSLPLFE